MMQEITYKDLPTQATTDNFGITHMITVGSDRNTNPMPGMEEITSAWECSCDSGTTGFASHAAALRDAESHKHNPYNV